MIDSHAHYTHARFQRPFRYLTVENQDYALAEGNLPELFTLMEQRSILCSVEPGISLESNEEILLFCEAHPGRVFPAIGVHPTRTFAVQWRNRRRLEDLSRAPGVVAIGETGLDYHYARKDQHRFCQYCWFLYQLGLAWRRKLPLILHIRDAYEDALRILRHHPARSCGGVVHCFNGTRQIAEDYLELGFFLGIGGSILQPEEQAGDLWEAVRTAPLERLLLETDAPFVLPYCKDRFPGKLRRRSCNTSLILPKVAEKIAELKGLSAEEVERVTTENAIRLFSLPVTP